jgi:hypothetical protein
MEEEDGFMHNSKIKNHPDSRFLNTPKMVEDQRIVSPNAIRGLCKTEERSRESHDIVSIELLESLKQEMMVLGDQSAEICSQISPQTFSHMMVPLEKGELVLKNTSYRISLLHE